MSAPSSFAPPRLELRGISKRYPGCLANDRIDLCIDAGEIHALLGENGAGKSTLMKIIYGVTRPDAGEIRWQGEPVQVRDPARARALGIGMVFQHFSLFETLSVAENIALALGAEAGSPRRLEARIREVSQRYGMPLEPRRLVHGLSIGERQRVEIVRCLMQDIRLLILDEPTSVLTPREAEDLFVTLRRLAEEGCSVLFISHKLAEVRALCQRATVLRGGRVAGQCVPAQCSDLELARLMVGDAEGLAAEYPKVTGGAPFLQVRDLHWRNPDPFGVSFAGLDLEVRSGESRAGQAFVPAERLGHGAVPEMSLADNALLTAFQQGLVRRGLVRRRKVLALAEEIIRRFAVKAPGAGAPARSLSGGNLQKFILGREILQAPRLLVAAHPTWGVDVGAAALIHRALIALRDAGTAILVVSEDLDELFLLSDRIAALCSGRLCPAVATASASPQQVGGWMAGQFEAPAAVAGAVAQGSL